MSDFPSRDRVLAMVTSMLSDDREAGHMMLGELEGLDRQELVDTCTSAVSLIGLILGVLATQSNGLDPFDNVPDEEVDRMALEELRILSRSLSRSDPES